MGISSPNIIIIRSKGIRWAGHITRMRKKEKCTQDFGGEIKRKETTRKTQI
jgi:hypothetical protein